MTPPQVGVVDVHAAFRPTFRVARLLGLAPLSLSNAPPRFHASPLAALHAGLLFVAVAVLTALTIADLAVVYFKDQQLGIQTAVSYSQVVFDALLSLYLLASGACDAESVATTFSRLHDVDATLAGVGVGVAAVASRRVLAASAALFAVNYVVLAASLATGSLVVTNTLVLYWLLYQIPKVFSYGFVVFLSTQLWLLRQRFAAIRQHLDLLARRAAAPASVGVGKQQAFDIAQMATLRAQHDQLCDLAAAVNACYALRVLLCAASVFANLTTEMNYVIVQLLVYSMSLADVIHSAVLLAIVMAQVVFVAVSCAVTGREANAVAHFVHKLLTKTRDCQLRNELRLFSLQLLHRRVHFTACGFFPLDATLLYSIAGGVTTYLVILIQFQLNSANAGALANATLANATLSNATLPNATLANVTTRA